MNLNMTPLATREFYKGLCSVIHGNQTCQENAHNVFAFPAIKLSNRKH